MIFSCLIKKSKLKAIEIETAFFNPLENPKGRTLDYFFYASYISKKVKELSMKTVQVHLIIGTTLLKSSCRAVIVC